MWHARSGEQGRHALEEEDLESKLNVWEAVGGDATLGIGQVQEGRVNRGAGGRQGFGRKEERMASSEAGGWRSQEDFEAWFLEKARGAACDVLDPALAHKLGICPPDPPCVKGDPAVRVLTRLLCDRRRCTINCVAV